VKKLTSFDGVQEEINKPKDLAQGGGLILHNIVISYQQQQHQPTDDNDNPGLRSRFPLVSSVWDSNVNLLRVSRFPATRTPPTYLSLFKSWHFCGFSFCLHHFNHHSSIR
jgi:hypothetical protein